MKAESCAVGSNRSSAQCTDCNLEDASLELGLILGGIILVFFLLYFSRKNLMACRRKFGPSWRNFLRIVTINLSYLQVTTSLPRIVPVKWPEEYVLYLEKMEWVNVDLVNLMKLRCFGGNVWDFRMNVFVACLIPVLPMIVTFVFYRLKKLRLRRLKIVSKSAQDKVAGVLEYMFDFADYDDSGYIDMKKFMSMMRYARGKEANHLWKKYTLLSEHKRRSNWLKLNRKPQEANQSLNKKLEKAEKKLMYKLEDLMCTFGAFRRRRSQSNKSNKDNVLCISRRQFLSISNDTVLERLGLAWIIQAESMRLWSVLMSGLLVFLFFVHAPVSQRFFYYFSCHHISGKQYLRSDYSMQCYTGAHATFLPFVIVAMLSFTFLFPILVGFQLFKRRKNLRSAINRFEYGFLYLHFSVGAEFWEFHELFRKLILTGLIVFLGNFSQRAVIAILVCLVSVAFLNYFRPHVSSIVFMVEQISFISATFKYIAVLLLDTKTSIAEKASHSEPNILGKLLIALDILFAVGSFLSLFAIIFVAKSSIRNSIKIRHENHGVDGRKRVDHRGSFARRSIVFHQASLETLKNDLLARKTEEKYDQERNSQRQRLRMGRTICQKRLQRRLKKRKLEMRQSKEKTRRTGKEEVKHDVTNMKILPEEKKVLGNKAGVDESAKPSGTPTQKDAGVRKKKKKKKKKRKKGR